MTKHGASAQDQEEPQGPFGSTRQGKLGLIKKDNQKPTRQKRTKNTMGAITYTWINSSSANDDEVQARISKRAHELYRDRGGPHGQDFEDWLRASLLLFLSAKTAARGSGMGKEGGECQ